MLIKTCKAMSVAPGRDTDKACTNVEQSIDDQKSSYNGLNYKPINFSLGYSRFECIRLVDNCCKNHDRPLTITEIIRLTGLDEGLVLAAIKELANDDMLIIRRQTTFPVYTAGDE